MLQLESKFKINILWSKIWGTLQLMAKNSKLLLLAIILFSILIRLPYLNCPLQPDEGAYAYQAYFWLQGENPYNSRFFHMLPGLPFIFMLVFKLFGTNLVNLRVFITFYNVLSTLFIYLVTCRLLEKKAALLSAFFFTYLSWLPIIRGCMGKEIFLLLPCLIALYFYLLHDKKLYYLFLCGLFSVLAICIRQSSILLLGHFLLFLYLVEKQRVKKIAIFSLGIFIPLILSSSYSYFFLGQEKFIYHIISYRLTTNSIFVGPIWYHFLRFFYSIGATGFVFLFGACLWGWQFLPKNLFAKKFLVSYLLFSFGTIIIGGNWFFHYYLQLVPALSICLGWIGINMIGQERLKKIVFIALASIPFLFYLLAAHHTCSHCLMPEENNHITTEIASYIKKYSSANDKIYAFLYYNPSLYFLAQRESGFPYLFRDETLFEPHRLKELTEAIKTNEITYLITHSLENSIKIAKRRCDKNFNTMDKFFKKCFAKEFTPFCKNYPIQLMLIKKFFSEIPKYYQLVKCIPFQEGKIIIWRSKQKSCLNE